MKELDENPNNVCDFEPEKGCRGLSSSNKVTDRHPFSGIYPNSNNMDEETLLEYLASILVDGYLDLKNYEFMEDNSK